MVPDDLEARRTAGRRRTTWRGRAVRAALALIAGLLAVTGSASPAQAHAVLVSSSPEADSLLQEAPTQVVLTFTEAVSPVADRVRVIAPDGRRVDRNEARPSGEQLIIPLATITQPGTYLVTFRVISADSHPVFGAFSFSYQMVSPGGPPEAEGVQPSGFVLAALPVARWIGYLGLVLLVGATVVLTLLWPRRLDRRDPLRVAYLGAGLLALGTVLALVLYVPYVAGGGIGDITSADLRQVLSDQYGAAHLVRLGALGAALVLLRAVAQGRGWTADKVMLTVLGVIGVGTWSISGHPSATQVPTVSVTADMVHLAAMSFWVGGLAMLALFLLPRATAPELAAIVPVWSRWATYAVGALLLTGLAQSLLEVRPLGALVDTSYGLVLLAKVALVAVVIAVAYFSRRLVQVIAGVAAPGPAGSGQGDAADADHAEATETGTSLTEAPQAEAPQADTSQAETPQNDTTVARRLRRLVVVEAVVALAVIGVTSVLVQLTPARTAAESSEAVVGGVQSVTLRDERFTLTADLRPGRVGLNELHLFAYTPDMRPLTVAEWRVVASASATGIEGVEAAVVPITPDHAIAQIGLPAPGTWTFTFTLRLDEFTNGIVTGQMTISN